MRLLFIAVALATFASVLDAQEAPAPPVPIQQARPLAVVGPLDSVTLDVPAGSELIVSDGRGREYRRLHSPGTSVTFRVGGALGTHVVTVRPPSGNPESLRFELRTTTRIEDEGGRMKSLLPALKRSLDVYAPHDNGVQTMRFRGKDYRYYVSWLRDHVHTLKGQQYWDGSGHEAIDLFRETQRPDGMIWDFFSVGRPNDFWDTAYGPIGYCARLDDLQMVRMPAEADVEYLFVEGLHRAWQMRGDDEWMKRCLDAAVRALDYSVSDEARYSTKFGLVKRGYTIDTWDFQVDDDFTRTNGRWGSLTIDPKRSRFGVMFGDNTGYAQACERLATMLERAGRGAEADRFRKRAAEIRRRLDELAWLGTHFRHWVAEDPSVVRDLGVDEKAQLSLSNAYSLNRGIRHEQAVAILDSYARLRGSLPPGSPGEWYTIHPPFERGFGSHAAPWQYVNGGVSPIIAGELARGAFEHGREWYGADILLRLAELVGRHDRLYFAYTGAFPESPKPVYAPVDLRSRANMDTGPMGAAGVPGWMKSTPDDHLAELPVGVHELAGVPFALTDPATNGRRAVVAVSNREGLPASVAIPIGRKAGAVYLLHAAGEVGPSGVAGSVTFRYVGGGEATRYLMNGRDVSTWWFAEEPGETKNADGHPVAGRPVRLAWTGRNGIATRVGLLWCGLDNPKPESVIESIDLGGSLEGAIYALAGLTLSDQPTYVRPPEVSFGGPDNWAAAAVVYALVEGLAGVVDRDVALRKAEVSPRFVAMGVDGAKVRVHYPGSDGYVAYDYRHDASGRQVVLELTGSGEEAGVHVLLPSGVSKIAAVRVDGAPVSFRTSRVEESFYADLTLSLGVPRRIVVEYEP